MSRVLVVEDEQHIAEGLRFNLEAEGHEVFVSADGEQALALILDDREMFDVIVLDVMLPGRDGFFVAAALRSAGQFLPILMLTARNRPEDVLKGFEAGADDYLPKPFELAILLARINGLLRRRRWNETPLDPARGRQQDGPAAPTRDVYTFGDRTLDFTAMEVQARGKSYRLTQMECELLRYLVTHAGQPVSRGALLENVWGLHEQTDT
ncbi:MAG TPA: response regulator transcription factor, partial [Vicinamibacterales bacterium]